MSWTQAAQAPPQNARSIYMYVHKREVRALGKTNLIFLTLQRTPINTTSYKVPIPQFLAKVGKKLNVLAHLTGI